jgi:hypothetical protein
VVGKFGIKFLHFILASTTAADVSAQLSLSTYAEIRTRFISLDFHALRSRLRLLRMYQCRAI